MEGWRCHVHQNTNPGPYLAPPNADPLRGTNYSVASWNTAATTLVARVGVLRSTQRLAKSVEKVMGFQNFVVLLLQPALFLSIA